MLPLPLGISMPTSFGRTPLLVDVPQRSIRATSGRTTHGDARLQRDSRSWDVPRPTRRQHAEGSQAPGAVLQAFASLLIDPLELRLRGVPGWVGRTSAPATRLIKA